MDIHKNARLSFRSREALARLVVEQGATRKAAAVAFRVSAKTAAKWVVRFRIAGLDGLLDRSSRPHRSPRQTPSSLLERVLSLRRQHLPGYEIARRTGLSPASVSRILRRARLSRWRDLLTDNGSSYRSKQFRQACLRLQLRHRRTRPYSPQTNGKAERFIQTALREWAYAKHWADSEQRDACLKPWNDYYNRERPHGSLNYKPPISRSENGTTS